MGAALPWIAIGSTILGAMNQSEGAQQTATANSQAMQYQAAVARNNETIANMNAALEIQKGQQMESASREKTAQTIGGIVAKFGAGSIIPSEGTPLRLSSDTASLGELDALTIRNNAARNAWNYQSQAQNLEAQAVLDEHGAASATRAGDIASTGSIIGGAASVADKWLRYSSAGIIGGGSGGGIGAGVAPDAAGDIAVMATMA